MLCGSAAVCLTACSPSAFLRKTAAGTAGTGTAEAAGTDASGNRQSAADGYSADGTDLSGTGNASFSASYTGENAEYITVKAGNSGLSFPLRKDARGTGKTLAGSSVRNVQSVSDISVTDSSSLADEYVCGTGTSWIDFRPDSYYFFADTTDAGEKLQKAFSDGDAAAAAELAFGGAGNFVSYTAPYFDSHGHLIASVSVSPSGDTETPYGGHAAVCVDGGKVCTALFCAAPYSVTGITDTDALTAALNSVYNN